MVFRMLITSTLIGSTFVFCQPVQALAQPIDDVSRWADGFLATAKASDFSKLSQLVEEVADPRFKTASISDIVAGFKKVVGDEKAIYVEQFQNKQLGHVMQRLNFAVLYPKGALFYSVVFARAKQGWQLLGFAADGNVNHILALDWPG